MSQAPKRRRTYLGTAWKIVTLGYGGRSSTPKPLPVQEEEMPRAVIHEPAMLEAISASDTHEGKKEQRSLDDCRTNDEVITYLQQLIDEIQTSCTNRLDNQDQDTHVETGNEKHSAETGNDTQDIVENEPRVQFIDEVALVDNSGTCRRRHRPMTPFRETHVALDDEGPQKKVKMNPEDVRLEMDMSMELLGEEPTPTLCQVFSGLWGKIVNFFKFA